jgi:hypothetical protein
MVASILFGLAFVAIFAGLQTIKPGKSLFDRH